LWSSELIVKKSPSKHRWYVDIEHAFQTGVTVWIPIKNAENTILKLIEGSDQINVLPQVYSTNEDSQILNIALEHNDKCNIIEIVLDIGSAIIWKGIVWHGTEDQRNDDKLRMANTIQIILGVILNQFM
jgi:ectoine hydroxylase-related dioxygenase (phytanoyl-CoA dioxygenase family)